MEERLIQQTPNRKLAKHFCHYQRRAQTTAHKAGACLLPDRLYKAPRH